MSEKNSKKGEKSNGKGKSELMKINKENWWIVATDNDSSASFVVVIVDAFLSLSLSFSLPLN